MRYRIGAMLLFVVCMLLILHLLGVGGTAEGIGETQHQAKCSTLPFYGQPQFMLRVNDTYPEYEPNPTAADLDADGLEDILISKSKFVTYETFALDILLNDGYGSLVLATSRMFEGKVPMVQNPTDVIVTDFNGDGRNDIFIADHGYDDNPFPGYQNQLALSTTNGKLVDATNKLPQQSDFTHSACTADIDGDGDIDLYAGNIWGQNEINPQILLNDGKGSFTVGKNRLPLLTDLTQNGYTTCAFSDVNNDGPLDLILADAGDDIHNEHSTPDSELLLNDGNGYFTLLPHAMPPKDSIFDIGHDIELADLNGDAYIDLLIVYEGWGGPFEDWQGSYIQALVNKGNGTFRDETAARINAPERPTWIPELKMRDLDNDGDQDLLAFVWDDQNFDPLLFVNDGSGVFSWQSFKFGIGDLYYDFLDLYGNGGHDIVYITYAPPEDVYLIQDMDCPLYLPVVISGK